MPWQCAECRTEIDDDAVSACTECGHTKTAWTLFKDQTRRLRVGVGKRFVCERGEEDVAQEAPLTEAYDVATWAETEVAPAIPTAEARLLAEAGHGPAPCDVLRVVQHPGKGEPSAVQLTVLPEARRSETTEHEARKGPPHDARFLLVFGEPPGDLKFDGVQVIDVTDDRPEGHAPTVEVAALKRPFKSLAIVPHSAAEIDWSLFGFDVAEDQEVDWSLFGFDVTSNAGREEPASAAEEAEPAAEETDWSLFSFAVAKSADEEDDAPQDPPA